MKFSKVLDGRGKSCTSEEINSLLSLDNIDVLSRVQNRVIQRACRRIDVSSLTCYVVARPSDVRYPRLSIFSRLRWPKRRDVEYLPRIQANTLPFSVLSHPRCPCTRSFPTISSIARPTHRARTRVTGAVLQVFISRCPQLDDSWIYQVFFITVYMHLSICHVNE